MWSASFICINVALISVSGFLQHVTGSGYHSSSACLISLQSHVSKRARRFRVMTMRYPQPHSSAVMSCSIVCSHRFADHYELFAHDWGKHRPQCFLWGHAVLTISREEARSSTFIIPPFALKCLEVNEIAKQKIVKGFTAAIFMIIKPDRSDPTCVINLHNHILVSSYTWHFFLSLSCLFLL